MPDRLNLFGEQTHAVTDGSNAVSSTKSQFVGIVPTQGDIPAPVKHPSVGMSGLFGGDPSRPSEARSYAGSVMTAEAAGWKLSQNATSMARHSRPHDRFEVTLSTTHDA
jgi:hypothetical protein